MSVAVPLVVWGCLLECPKTMIVYSVYYTSSLTLYVLFILLYFFKRNFIRVHCSQPSSCTCHCCLFFFFLSFFSNKQNKLCTLNCYICTLKMAFTVVKDKIIESQIFITNSGVKRSVASFGNEGFVF